MKNEENDQQPQPGVPPSPAVSAADAPANPEEEPVGASPSTPGDGAMDDARDARPDGDDDTDEEDDSDEEDSDEEDSDEEDSKEEDSKEEDSSPTEEDDLPIASAPSDYSSDRAFRDFPLSEETLKGLDELGYRQATPVQVAAIEPGLAGRDLLVRAKTGTGKTAAFGIPILERVDAGSRKVGAVVLTPTRELALQVAEELTGIGRYKDLRVCTLYGGVAIGPQTDALKQGVEVVVGTPGRILDHLRRHSLDLSSARIACIDEADEMLSMGFLEDVTRILAALPKEPKPQVLLFSATVQEKIKGLVRRFLKDPVSLMLSTDTDRVEGIRHVLYETDINVHKIRSLLAVLDREQPTSALIFTNTREDTTTVANFLSRQGLDAEHISGDLPQSRREVAMRRLKQGRIQFLVATDVAARGIDISDLSHVLHYSLPEDPAVYLHRSGRTGRIGKSGVSIALAGGTDLSTRLVLERQYNIQFEVLPVPTPEEAGRLRLAAQVGTLRRAMGSCAFEGFLGTVRALKEHPEGDLLLAVALRTFFAWERERLAAEVEAGEKAAPAGEVAPVPQDIPADGGGRPRRGGGGGGGGGGKHRGRRRPPRKG